MKERENTAGQQEADFIVRDLGERYAFTPKSEKAIATATDGTIPLRPWQWLWDSFVVEYPEGKVLIGQLREKGFTIEERVGEFPVLNRNDV